MKKTSTTKSKRILQTHRDDPVVKVVGANTTSRPTRSGRIYLPGSWIGRKVFVRLVK